MELVERGVLGLRCVVTPSKGDERGLARFERLASVAAGTDRSETHAADQLQREIALPDGELVVAGRRRSSTRRRCARSRTAGCSRPRPRRVRAKQFAMRSNVPCAESSPGTRRYALPPLPRIGRSDDEEIPHRQPAGRRVPRRLQDVGARHIPALVGHHGGRGTEPERTRGPVEQGTEQARRIGPREAQPLHRSVSAQRACSPRSPTGTRSRRSPETRSPRHAPRSHAAARTHDPIVRPTARVAITSMG